MTTSIVRCSLTVERSQQLPDLLSGQQLPQLKLKVGVQIFMLKVHCNVLQCVVSVVTNVDHCSLAAPAIPTVTPLMRLSQPRRVCAPLARCVCGMHGTSPLQREHSSDNVSPRPSCWVHLTSLSSPPRSAGLRRYQTAPRYQLASVPETCATHTEQLMRQESPHPPPGHHHPHHLTRNNLNPADRKHSESPSSAPANRAQMP